MNRPPVTEPVINMDTNKLSIAWSQWIDQLWTRTYSIDNSGTTAQRPTKGIYIGLFYFDTTLNKPIWVKAYTAGAAVWIDAAGTVV